MQQFFSQILDDILFALWENGFIISRESTSFKPEDVQHPSLVLLTSHRNGEETIIMLGRAQQLNPAYMRINDDPEFSWLPELQSLAKTHKDIVIYSEHEPLNGIMGFINCWKREPDVKSVRAVFIMDDDMSFNAEDPIFAKQLEKNLVQNVYKNGQWGTYRHFPITLNQEVKPQHIFLGQQTTGDLSSLRWMEGPLNGAETKEIPPEMRLVEVCYDIVMKKQMTTSGCLTFLFF